MSYETIVYNVDDRVAVISFNRPERLNAFSPRLCGEAVAAFAAADADDDVRVVVVTGAGGKAFSAGFDLEATADRRPATVEDWRAYLAETEPFAFAPWRCSKPVIAMVDGHCLGGGLELALMCDIRYAGERARFAAVEARFSAGIATLILPWVVGARARELIYSGDTVDAARALQIGLVDAVFASEALAAETMRRAKRMARVALSTLRYNKQALNFTQEAMGFERALGNGLEVCARNNATPSPEARRFRELVEREGVKAAVAWQRSLFAPYE